MTTLKIKVTKDVLERSKMCNSHIPVMNDQKKDVGANCAVSVAIRDIFPLAFVSSLVIYPFFYGIFPGNTSYPIHLPSEATLFIRRFDYIRPEDRVEMDELEFEVRIPDNVIEQIDIEEIRELLASHPTLELV